MSISEGDKIECRPENIKEALVFLSLSKIDSRLVEVQQKKCSTFKEFSKIVSCVRRKLGNYFRDQ